jgi:hypothetical protein
MQRHDPSLITAILSTRSHLSELYESGPPDEILLTRRAGLGLGGMGRTDGGGGGMEGCGGPHQRKNRSAMHWPSQGLVVRVAMQLVASRVVDDIVPARGPCVQPPLTHVGQISGREAERGRAPTIHRQ